MTPRRNARRLARELKHTLPVFDLDEESPWPLPGPPPGPLPGPPPGPPPGAPSGTLPGESCALNELGGG